MYPIAWIRLGFAQYSSFFDLRAASRDGGDCLLKKKKKATIHPAMKAGFLLIVIAVFIGLAGTVISLQLQISDLRAQSSDLQTEITRMEQQNKEFKDSMETGNTDESIAKIARDVLGYASPGERVYVDSSEQ